MKIKPIWAGAGIVALAVAVAAQAQWSDQGWGPGNGGMGLGRTEGPVMVDISSFGSETNVAVTVSECGGPRDHRTFGSAIDGGEPQVRDIEATLIACSATRDGSAGSRKACRRASCKAWRRPTWLGRRSRPQ